VGRGVFHRRQFTAEKVQNWTIHRKVIHRKNIKVGQLNRELAHRSANILPQTVHRKCNLPQKM
jgi:hypothetical protein